ncbi:lipopolysaccharide transport system ATP-binding protein [Methylomagnum ishizawai]|uniref:Lipopolysaccharide transport system ATP-binding protein n=1 Tax=Methylomagnum ishizawai TaxID=1760988 RepID=A0A1Y6D412_9GAMM|nr:ABC transporter ATP-binding protein [Methylomagnum ishizawai]SMF97160.1 lipopolysaccharide transport system ATP-binding protein [Methylomagnum ishizawai]
MSQSVILFEGVGKKFRRSLASAALYGLQDCARALVGRKPPERLREQEFWALRDVSFAAGRGECIGIIGPNGAGKSTLLKLVDREYRPDTGRIATRGAVKSLVRLGAGLQPLLTGRENIYLKCAELGLGKRETDAVLDRIAGFAGLEKSLDAQVKHYSDGMYARLEFSIATCVPMDILLIDEVLAVGDIAFQMRCLERLDQLKRLGTTILFVSHSEMNVRQIADRCLLLFDGEALAFGTTDVLFLKYYESLGFVQRALKPLGLAPEPPAVSSDVASIARLAVAGGIAGLPKARTGGALTLTVDYTAKAPVERAALVLEFRGAADLLMATLDSALNGAVVALAGRGRLRVVVPFLGLAAGVYRIAGGFRRDGAWLGYGPDLLRLTVEQGGDVETSGLFALRADIEALD